MWPRKVTGNTTKASLLVSTCQSLCHLRCLCLDQCCNESIRTRMHRFSFSSHADARVCVVADAIVKMEIRRRNCLVGQLGLGLPEDSTGKTPSKDIFFSSSHFQLLHYCDVLSPTQDNRFIQTRLSIVTTGEALTRIDVYGYSIWAGCLSKEA